MAGIIKSGKLHPRRSGVQAVAFNLEDMSNRADRYLQQVQAKAEAIVNDAKARAEEIEAEVVAKVRREVEAQVAVRIQAGVDEKLESLMPALRSVLQAVEHAKQSCLMHWQQEILQLALAIAERVLRRELPKCPEASQTLIREALELSVGGGQFKLHLNPQDVETLGSWVERLSAEVGQLLPTDIVADEEVSPGGCRVVSKFGIVDQTIEAQLDRIREELVEQTEPQG